MGRQKVKNMSRNQQKAVMAKYRYKNIPVTLKGGYIFQDIKYKKDKSREVNKIQAVYIKPGTVAGSYWKNKFYEEYGLYPSSQKELNDFIEIEKKGKELGSAYDHAQTSAEVEAILDDMDKVNRDKEEFGKRIRKLS